MDPRDSLLMQDEQRLGGTPDNLAEIPSNGDIVVPGMLSRRCASLSRHNPWFCHGPMLTLNP